MTWHRTPEEQGQSRLRNWHQRNPSHQHVGFIAPSREPRNRTRPAPVAHAPRRRTSYRGQGTQLGPGEVAGAYHSGPPWPGNSLIALAAERAPLRKASPATGRLAEYSRARAAQHHGLRVGEHGGDVEAALALNVHEERVRGLHETLELVLRLLELSRRVQEVNVGSKHLFPPVRS